MQVDNCAKRLFHPGASKDHSFGLLFEQQSEKIQKVPQYTVAENGQSYRKDALRATCPAGCYLVSSSPKKRFKEAVQTARVPIGVFTFCQQK